MKQLSGRNVSPPAVLEMPVRDAYGPHWSHSGKGVPGYSAPDEASYLPARNLILIVKAAVYLDRRGVHELAIGTLAGNPFPDSKKSFHKKLGGVLTESLGRSFKIRAPLSAEKKAELIQSAPDLPFQFTLSCAKPQGIWHCGRCSKCAERQRAFRTAQVPDPTQYRSHRG